MESNQTLIETLEHRGREALRDAAGGDALPAVVQPATRPEFGDYQMNGVMAAARTVGIKPRELAQRVVDRLDIAHLAEKVDIAGPGFINIRLRNEYLTDRVQQSLTAAGLAVPGQSPERIVVDYSSPNLAKEMHVGHLRTTVIGDALVRVLTFLGHEVIRQNHVGDWGTQFGMLTAFLDAQAGGAAEAEYALADLEGFYRRAKQSFDEDPAFARRAREFVVRLQSGDAEVNALWRRFVDISLQHCESVYARLGVLLTRDDVRGESAYNDDLQPTVADLQSKGLAVASEGAQVVFLDDVADQTGGGQSSVFIVRKQDGGYLYSTSDLAAIRYRVGRLGARRIYYVVDARQSLHFRQLFAVARLAGYAPASTQLMHVDYGVILGRDGRPFKTRSGDTVMLSALLDEAEQRAYELVRAKNENMSDADARHVAHVVGIGAVKYADLCRNRNTDYVFDWDAMLSFDGNTAPYLQYAYTRIAGVFRRADVPSADTPIRVNEDIERTLLLHLARFAEALHGVARDAAPHVLCSYLFELATLFMRFYESCPVIHSEGDLRASRLQLCRATGETLRTGLGLLGIEVLEAM